MTTDQLQKLRELEVNLFQAPWKLNAALPVVCSVVPEHVIAATTPEGNIMLEDFLEPKNLRAIIHLRNALPGLLDLVAAQREVIFAYQAYHVARAYAKKCTDDLFHATLERCDGADNLDECEAAKEAGARAGIEVINAQEAVNQARARLAELEKGKNNDNT